MNDEEFVAAEPFDLDGVQARRVVIRTARVEHVCWGLDGSQSHKIRRGERYRYESAIVNGRPGSFCICAACIKKWREEAK